MSYSKIISNNLPNAIYKISNKIINKGRGCWLYDIYDNKMLDFTSGIGVTSLGHNNIEVINAVKKQLDNLIHGQMNCMYNEPMLRLTRNLSNTMPKYLNNYFYTNSGSEAVENAIKIAKITSKKEIIISFIGGFHGRTIGASSISTSKILQRTGYSPLLGGIIHTKFPNNKDNLYIEADKDFQNIFENVVDVNNVAAVIIEPIQGEGGYSIANLESMRKIGLFCKNNGIYLILDEIQSGIGRTGKFLCYQNYNIEPDIVCIGKGIATGFPIGLVATSKTIMSKMPTNSIGGTYGGGPIVCAAADKTLEIIKRDNLSLQANSKGNYLLSKLSILKNDYNFIKDVRGMGLMIAMEFDTDLKGIAIKFSKLAEIYGLLVLTAGNNEVIRIIPPLTIDYNEIDIGVKLINEVLLEISKKFINSAL